MINFYIYVSVVTPTHIIFPMKTSIVEVDRVRRLLKKCIFSKGRNTKIPVCMYYFIIFRNTIGSDGIIGIIIAVVAFLLIGILAGIFIFRKSKTRCACKCYLLEFAKFSLYSF